MKKIRWVSGGIASLLAGIFVIVANAPIAAASDDFSLQVSPSPIVTTVKPGETTVLELKISNRGEKPEDLKIATRGFKLKDQDSTVLLNEAGPLETDGWVKFANPTFTVQPGQWFTQKINISVPKDAGFSYSFAVLISRASSPKATEGGRLIEGSIAVFTLINVDKPGATRKITVADFTSSQAVYEFLPAVFSVRLKNTGNTIVQPYGNIFVQRSSTDTTPITTLPVNEMNGYILPGKERTLTSEWSSGFPLYKVTVDEKGVENRSINWNIANIVNFRIGQYTAKLVAVYNDGQRDIPLETEITFWVIPWKSMLIITTVIVSLSLIGRKLNQRKTQRIVKKALAAQAAAYEKESGKKRGEQE